MATSALPLVVITALALAACDLSQKKPETRKASLPDAQAVAAPPGSLDLAVPQPAAVVQAPGVGPRSRAGAETSAGERSIRLYGPGVSRKRQIRV